MDILVFERDRLAAGEIAITVAEFHDALLYLIIFFFKRLLELLGFAFADGEGLFALAEFLGLVCGGVGLLLFEFLAFLFDLQSFALDGIALGGEFLLLVFLFELAVAFGRLVCFAFEFCELLGDGGIVGFFFASGGEQDREGGKRCETGRFHK